MSRLMWILHAIISTALMGVGVTAVLTMALPGWKPIALAAALGMALSFPVSWLVARRIESLSA
ncbi:MAG: hypothetical protein RL702_1324 [Pseudomonadota bacterium]|jgi:predicted PurR-regulated permease PerM|nr:hypothetical protein [Novosphingobium sp.]